MFLGRFGRDWAGAENNLRISKELICLPLPDLYIMGRKSRTAVLVTARQQDRRCREKTMTLEKAQPYVSKKL